MATWALTIAGVAKTIRAGWKISETANGRNRFSCRVISLDGSYAPTKFAEVIFTRDAVRVFGGQIMETIEHGVGGWGITPVEYEINVLDFNILADRNYIGVAVPSGTLKSHVLALQGYCYGTTLDVAQADGPTIPEISYEGWKISDAFDQLSVLSGGWLWEIDYNKVVRMVEPGTISAPFNVAAGDGHCIGDVQIEPISPDYFNTIVVWGSGFNTVVDDAAGVAAYGPIVQLIRAPDADTQAAVDDLGAAYLAQSLPIVKRVFYTTSTSGLHPNQTQTINLPTRHINAVCLLTGVDMRHVGGEQVVMWDVQAIEGLVYRTGWRDTLKTWGGTGGGITISGTGSGGIVFVRPPYYLGGSGLEAVQSPTPTWVFASAIRVQINTVPRGTTAASINVYLSALSGGVSAQARLFNVTDSVACTGTSSIETSTTPTLVTFAVTLTAGSKVYGLQVLPGTANEDVFATSGVLE